MKVIYLRLSSFYKKAQLMRLNEKLLLDSVIDSVVLLICDLLVGVTNREQLLRSNLYIFLRPIFVIKEWPLVEELSERKAFGRHSGRH